MATFDRIAVFGCKATTLFLLDNLNILPYQVSHLITITPDAGIKHDVADYIDLQHEAESRGISVYQARYYSLKHASDIAHINNLKLDIAFVMGWQRLVPAEILAGLNIGAFGMHGSAANLPLGRGRSPMNWSILEGRQVFYTNLFRYDPGVDSGDVVDTFKFQITPQDTAETMHFKNTLAMKFLVERNIKGLVNNNFSLTKQDKSIAPTYYPKRTPQDGLLDWGMDAAALERFIRAVTRPFGGAFTFVQEQEVRIWAAQVFDVSDFGCEKWPAGTVVAVFESGKFLVKCFGGLLLVIAHEADFPVEKGMRFDNNGVEIRPFKRNRFGNFDLEEEEMP
ncbi:MAG: methionyl-tRNA formyltransferase [Saprospiraceae bacterium]